MPLLDRLLKLGLDMEKQTKFGETPVVVAALHEAVEAVLFLQDKKANMYAKSVDGYIPFQIAVRYGFPEMMKALYESGGGERRGRECTGACACIVAIGCLCTPCQ